MPLDPILQQLIDQMPAMHGPIDHATARARATAMAPKLVGPAGLAEVAGIEHADLEGIGGPVPIRIYRPIGPATGTLQYIHGGGWAIGDLAMVDTTARRLCRNTSMVVVTSGYRLAPENRFPAAFDDTLVAARWVLAHLDDLGGGRRPAVIGGDSAGGNLSAAACIALRDAPERSRSFDLQWLLYPALDLRPDAFESASRKRDADPMVPTDALHTFIKDYLGEADPSDPRASPSAASSLTGLPSAFVVVLSGDPLRDEAVTYAESLRNAGVMAEVMEFPHLTHGFTHFAGIIPAADAAFAQVEVRLKKILGIVR